MLSFKKKKSFLASVPKHPILRKAIKHVVYHCKHKFFPFTSGYLPFNSLVIAGPQLLGKMINDYMELPHDAKREVELALEYKVQILKYCFPIEVVTSQDGDCKDEENSLFLAISQEYREEMKSLNIPHWSTFSKENLYKNN